MRARVFAALALALLWPVTASAQQQLQPLTFVSDYYIRPGKEADFMELVKTVGAPVRDKLMADGVILGWGVDVPVMRAPGQATHSIWYDVADWDALQKVQTAMAAQLEKMQQESISAGGRKTARAGKTFTERVEEILDSSKTRDWIFRNLSVNFSGRPPEGFLPYSRLFLISINPGKYDEWRAAWDKHNKPVLDKLVTDGVIGAYGIGTEEVRTSGDFTHFVWVGVPNLASFEKVRSAFMADRANRSAEERDAIARTFNSVTDPGAARSFVLRAVVFKMGPPPKQ